MLEERLDAGLHVLRTKAAKVVAMPLVWLHFHTNVESFRESQVQQVASGTQLIARLQRRMRTRELDALFQLISLLGEEDFIIFAISFVTWNVDHALGRKLLLLVCMGLLIANIYKDIFQLPRPASPPVWKPKGQESVNSSREYGLPSSHASTAIASSIFLFLSATCDPDTSSVSCVPRAMSDPHNHVWILLCIAYYVSVSFSRLYLGMHSPTDLRAGTIVGLLWVILYFPFSAMVDRYIVTSSWLGLQVFLLSAFLFFIIPQPRLTTPTVLLNALLVGVMGGAVLGSRAMIDHGFLPSANNSAGVFLSNDHVAHVGTWTSAAAVASIRAWALAWPRLAVFVRTIVGMVVVLLVRTLAKIITMPILRLVGLLPGGRKADGEASQTSASKVPALAPESDDIVCLFSRDTDILGNMIAKLIINEFLGLGILYFAPMFLVRSGLA
ncbi:Sphingosine-1-phosphate phosphatase 1 [Hondaea fermentalgiana]|uniref:Sphingosine-1-phosphate phosphatase 1 n=1 Tax=Hondaea fermentalgiana TaxID=2315210 RepID=A0A2R5GLD6_9STRA|nr:Sphingosine-1-phosphate phosphatase 1 [Hondaea fermentalgiana]|eukprot:GBG31690.1 Sphingosine-1-phosphate phosphatase 1 [Hondaea fermentalgiana]